MPDPVQKVHLAKFRTTIKASAEKLQIWETLIPTVVELALSMLFRMCPNTPTPSPVAGITLDPIQQVVLNSHLKKFAKQKKLRWIDNRDQCLKLSKEVLSQAKNKTELVALKKELGA